MTDVTSTIQALVLRAIAENRNDGLENDLHGEWIADREEDKKPACMKERGTFLSDRELTL